MEKYDRQMMNAIMEGDAGRVHVLFEVGVPVNEKTCYRNCS